MYKRYITKKITVTEYGNAIKEYKNCIIHISARFCCFLQLQLSYLKATMYRFALQNVFDPGVGRLISYSHMPVSPLLSLVCCPCVCQRSIFEGRFVLLWHSLMQHGQQWRKSRNWCIRDWWGCHGLHSNKKEKGKEYTHVFIESGYRTFTLKWWRKLTIMNIINLVQILITK